MLKKMGNNNLVRLQKFMAECGVASRRKSEELIEMGKVKVNGHVAHIGDKINPKKDIVAVRGKKITKEERLYYIMLNKPRGYVTTVSDEMQGFIRSAGLIKTVRDFLFSLMTVRLLMHLLIQSIITQRFIVLR
mgnify:CR=1 FL=1